MVKLARSYSSFQPPNASIWDLLNTTATPLGNSPNGSKVSTVSPGSFLTVTGLPAAVTAGSTIPICSCVSSNSVSETSHPAGKTVSLRIYAERIVAVAAGEIVGEHVRSFERDRTFFPRVTWRRWRRSPGRCATARRSRTGRCRRRCGK